MQSGRNLHFRLFLSATLIIFISFAITACGSGSSTDPPPSVQPPSTACGAIEEGPFSQEYLVGADTLDDTKLWVYAIDKNTGALTEMPWSPITTRQAVRRAIGHPNGKYLYLGDHESLHTGPGRFLETYEWPADPSQPLKQIDVQPSGYPGQLAFDPPGEHLFMVDPGPAELPLRIQAYNIGANGAPAKLPTFTPVEPREVVSMVFKEGGYVVVSRQFFNPDPNSIIVYRHNCATAELTKVSEYKITKGMRFLAAPYQGKYVVGYDCVGEEPGAQVFTLDVKAGTIVPVEGAFYPNICWFSFDRQGKYAVASVKRQQWTWDILAVFELLADGRLVERSRYQIPQYMDSNSNASNLRFNLDGTLVSASLHRSIGVFRLDRTSGALSPATGTPYPTPTSFSPLEVVGKR